MKNFKDVYNEVDSCTILVTNDCNLACDYCFEKNKGKEYIDEKTIIDIADAAYRKLPEDNPNKFTFNLFGGEPMLNWPAIKALCDHIKKKHWQCSISITSNLTMLTDEMIKYIDDFDIFMLVSVDGTKEAHDKHRCGSYDKVISNIKKLIDHDLSFLIEARMTVTPETAKYMASSVKMFLDMGINNICPVAASDLEWSPEALEDFRKSYQEICDMYLDILNDENNTRNIGIHGIDNIVKLSLEPSNQDGMMCNIYNPRWAIFDWKANVYPCPDFPTTDNEDLQKEIIGNLYTGVDDTKLSDKPMIAKFDNEKCKDCEARVICKSGCPYQNYNSSGDFTIATDAYCAIERIYLEEIKKFRERLLEAKNIRSRELNILVENIKVKKYFDTVLMESGPMDRDFKFKLDHLQELCKNLDVNNNLLPMYKEYYTKKMFGIFAIMAGIASIDLNEIKNETTKEK